MTADPPTVNPKIPTATYRVQVNPTFNLAATVDIVGYLAELGVSHLYTAPLLTATPGSSHGYDVVDHRQVNPELGGEPERQRLVGALREAGLGLVVDIVPNHVGVAVAAANPAWWDLLRHGRDSRYAQWFDIDWSRGRLVLPVLGDDEGALDQLKVEGDELHYFERRFPIAPGTSGGSAREVHDRQHYELVSWRRGDSEINYRRFFAISDLAGLRVEDRAVFEATHAEVLRWYAAGEVDGIRVDHPDGLRDPGDYLRRLSRAAPQAWLVIEKIIEPGERLPDWPVAGSTGYDALAEVCGVFVDCSTEALFTSLDARLSGQPRSWPDVARQGKLEAATGLLAAELDRLSRFVPDVGQAREGLAELAACFPVYRSYLPFGGRHLADARAEAGRRRPDLTGTLDALTARLRNPLDELAVRFQQFTGAVMAKGVEDTAFYRYNRFTALTEVGGDPYRFGIGPDAFHAAAGARQQRWPTGMTTLSTHDTKRAEDVRARLAVLSELPGEWSTAVERWHRAAPLPDAEFAHLLWQATVGAWPIERDRLYAYAEKAAREAAVATSWAQPSASFETALRELVDRIFDDAELNADVGAFARSLDEAGWSNGLGQKLVQLAMPGVPDVYQGAELWDISLVDPDNRRAVDFTVRRELLARLDEGWQPPVDASGAAKLLVTSRVLRLRRQHPELFEQYHPRRALGPSADNLLAFDRGGVVAAVTRLPVGLARRGGWRDTSLPLSGNDWKDLLTNRVYRGPAVLVSELLASYPIALLVPDSVSVS